MAGLIDSLVETMSKENDIYKELIPIASKKTQVIIKNDLHELQMITEEEQLVIEKINALERKREEIVKDIGNVLSKKTSDLTMRALIRLMDKQPAAQKQLCRVHDELESTVKTLVMLNDRNRALLQQSLEMVEFNMNLIQSTRMVPGVNNYTRGARAEYSPVVGTRMFDTRQ